MSDSARHLVSIAGFNPTAFEGPAGFAWRTFSTCRVETFSTPAFTNGRASAECRRGTQSACATFFLQATFSRNQSGRLERVAVQVNNLREVH